MTSRPASRRSGFRGPLQTGVAVFDGSRIRMLGCKPVLHRDHDRFALSRVGDEGLNVASSMTEDHAATVHVVDGWPWTGAFGGREDQQRDVRISGQSRDRALVHRDPSTCCEVDLRSAKVTIRHDRSYRGKVLARQRRKGITGRLYGGLELRIEGWVDRLGVAQQLCLRC